MTDLTDNERRIVNAVEHNLDVGLGQDDDDRRRHALYCLTAQASIIYQLVESVSVESIRQELSRTYSAISGDIATLKQRSSLSSSSQGDSL